MWEITLSGQIGTVVPAAVLGGLLCLFYDFFRSVRRERSCRAPEIFLQDVGYAFVAALLTFCLLLVRSNGEIRGYVLAFEAVGFGLFRRFLSRFFLRLFRGILRFFHRETGKIVRAEEAMADFFGRLFEKIPVFLKKIFKKRSKPEKNS